MSKNRKKQAAVPVEDTKIKDFLDMIAPGIIKFNTDHFICGNTLMLYNKNCHPILKDFDI